MKQYLNFVHNRSNSSFKHSFDLIFQKIETMLFILLSLVFLFLSRSNNNFARNIEAIFVEVSLPIIHFSALPFNSIINLVTDFKELANAKKENEILKEDLRQMHAFYIKSLNIHQENQELQRVLNFVTTKSSDYKIAKIIGRANQVFNQNLFIDIGQNNEVKLGNIVTGNKSIIGRISEVYSTKSRLMLLNDSNSRIPIIISRTRSRGILVGDGSNIMKIIYLPKNDVTQEGDLVFTSGDGDTLPPGLLVGMVTEVSDNHVAVEMVENINSIDVVTIINY